MFEKIIKLKNLELRNYNKDFLPIQFKGTQINELYNRQKFCMYVEYKYREALLKKVYRHNGIQHGFSRIFIISGKKLN